MNQIYQNHNDLEILPSLGIKIMFFNILDLEELIKQILNVFLLFFNVFQWLWSIVINFKESKRSLIYIV